MIHALMGLGGDQFEWARWSPENYLKYKFIRVSRVSDNERRFATAIQNITTATDTLLLRTSYLYDYKPRQHILYRDKWYEIVGVTEDNGSVNPQAMSLVNGGVRAYILELQEADGYDVE